MSELNEEDKRFAWEWIVANSKKEWWDNALTMGNLLGTLERFTVSLYRRENNEQDTKGG